MAASMVPTRRWHGRFPTILSDAETGGLRRTDTGPLRIRRPRRRGGGQTKSDYLEIGAPGEIQDGCAVLPQTNGGCRLGYHCPMTSLSPARPPKANAEPTRWLPLVSRTQKKPLRKMPGLLLPEPVQSPTTGTS